MSAKVSAARLIKMALGCPGELVALLYLLTLALCPDGLVPLCLIITARYLGG